MERAKVLVGTFILRAAGSASEVVGWARPHLENLNRSLIGVIPRGGVPEEYQRHARQYRAIFTQRLDSLLRDIEIGYDTEKGFTPHAPEAAVAATPSNWVPIKGSVGSFVDNGPRPMPRVMAEAIGSIPPQPQETATERPGPQSVPEVMAVLVQGATSSSAAGNLSTELNVDLAGPPGNRRTQAAAIVEQRVSERPEEIRAAARALSRAISEQIEDLNASRLNDPDALDRQGALIEFLQRIAAGLDDLATSLEAVIEAGSPETQKSSSAKAATVARSLASFVREGFDKQRAAIQACVINGPLLAGSVLLFHALGVDPTVAFTGMGTIMGFKMISKGAEAKE